jgi:hypothetical protein
MNSTKILAPAALFMVVVLGASPAHAQAHGYPRRGGFGVSRGQVRGRIGPRTFVGPRGAIPRPIVGGSPFYSSHYFVRPAVRVGYGVPSVSVGYPVAFAGPYPYPNAHPYPYSYPHPYPAPSLVFGPARGYSAIPGRSSLAIIGRIGGRLTRGAARLAFRLLIP